LAVSIEYKDASSATGTSTAYVRATSDNDDAYSTTAKSSSAIAKAAAINSLTETTGVRAIVGETKLEAGNAITGGTLDTSNYITINGEQISGFTVQANDANGALTDAINAVSEETGVVASLDENSQLVLTAADGRNIEVEVASNGGTRSGLSAGTTYGKISLQSNDQFTLGGSGAGTAGTDPINHAGGVYGVNSDKAVSSVDISTRSGAVEALDVIDLALEHVSSSRAKLGALQNRLESTINNLSTTSENLSASRSRILDADFAAETAKLSRNQIIQQAGVSILAQANQQPQVALALLG
jgi:flagellin